MKLLAPALPEVESLGNEDIDLGAADKDEVEMIEISDKEVSELLDIHASSNAATEKDAQSDQKDESIEITDSDDAGQNGGCTETSEAGKEAAENATTGTADDTVETLSDDKSADAELDASEQKADDATTCTDKASLPDDMEQSSKESSSEVLDLMDAADDSYHSDSSDIQFGAECDAPDSAATHKDGNAGESSSVKNSEPKAGESEKNKPSLPSETKKGETVESTNEAEVSKQQEKQAVEPSAVIDLDASSTESDGNKSATEEDADASKKGDDESTKQDDTATKNESVASKQQEKSEAAAEPSAIIDLDASSTESYDNKSATEEDVDASNKDSDPAVQEEISEICTNESIDESLMTDPVELQTAGVEENDNKEESTDIAKVQEVAEEIEEVVGEKVDTTFDGSSELQSQEKETPDDSAEVVECQPAEKLVSSEDDVVSAETSSKPVNSNSEPMDTEDGQLSSNDAEVMDITEEQEWPSSSHGKELTEMDPSEGMEQEAKDLPNTEQLQLAEVEVVDSSLMSADSSSITNNNKPTASDSDNEKEGQLPPSQSTGELSSESSNATPVVNSIVSKKVEAAADNSSNEREESEADELFTTPPDLAELAPSSMEVDSSNLNSEP
uniref:Uncharacterized protein n=1 Tax=Anopheles melas TaxID=34690 RepID=A0A182UFD0_9DIPT